MYKIFPMENVPCGHFKFTLTSSRRRMFYEYSNVRTRLNKRREGARVTYSSCRGKAVTVTVVMAVCRTTFIHSLTYFTFLWRITIQRDFLSSSLSEFDFSPGWLYIITRKPLYAFFAFFFSSSVCWFLKYRASLSRQGHNCWWNMSSTLKKIPLVTSEGNIRWNNSMVQTLLSH